MHFNWTNISNSEQLCPQSLVTCVLGIVPPACISSNIFSVILTIHGGGQAGAEAGPANILHQLHYGVVACVCGVHVTLQYTCVILIKCFTLSLPPVSLFSPLCAAIAEDRLLDLIQQNSSELDILSRNIHQFYNFIYSCLLT